MDLKTTVIQSLPPSLQKKVSQAPDAHMTRQAWQELVECLVKKVRQAHDSPYFGLTNAEISVHYHRAIVDFISFVRSKLH